MANYSYRGSYVEMSQEHSVNKQLAILCTSSIRETTHPPGVALVGAICILDLASWTLLATAIEPSTIHQLALAFYSCWFQHTSLRLVFPSSLRVYEDQLYHVRIENTSQLQRKIQTFHHSPNPFMSCNIRGHWQLAIYIMYIRVAVN